MTEATALPEGQGDSVEELRAHAQALERQLADLQRQSATRLALAEVKAEAVRAGMFDLDGLKLLDLSAVHINETGEVDNAAELIGQFKKVKPWLFGSLSSSAPMTAPLAQVPRQKHASEMSSAEYIAARAALLKQRY